jgi:PAS domain S-box-containing protein
MTTHPAKWIADFEQPAPPLESSYALIVEDDVDTRENLADILELDGYRVETAGSAREALARDDWARISVVILDRRLPDGDALDLLPQIKKRSPQSAVVIVTGYADLEGAITALRQGAADYILKPVNADAIRVSLSRLADGQRMQWALRHSRAQLQEERDFVESLLETVPSFVLLLNSKGHIVRFNAYLEELTGYPSEALHGRNALHVFIPVQERPRIRDLMRTLRDEGRIVGVINSILTRNGQKVDVRWSAKLVRDNERAIVGILASGQDITELKQAQDKALQSERLAAIGETMTGLIHESRNALQRTHACLELLVEEVADRPAALDFVKRAQRAQDDLRQLFEEVREYAAPIKLDCAPCDLASIWRQAWHDLEHLHTPKRLKLAELTADQDPRCHADAFAMAQVFRNVLENAIHASPESGRIDVHCECLPTADGPHFRIGFRDAGPGIPAEFRRQVLDPFFTTKAKGTGLGLAIARRIVQSHGGEITVGNNSNGPGAMILIDLPRGFR